MKIEIKIAGLREKLSKAYAIRRRQKYIKDAPHTQNLFDGQFLSLHQIRFIKQLNAFEERAYAKYLRKPISEIRRWAIETHKVPRELLRAETAYGLQLAIQQYKKLKTKKFIAELRAKATK